MSNVPLRVAFVSKSGFHAGGASGFEKNLFKIFSEFEAEGLIDVVALGPDRVPTSEGGPGAKHSRNYSNSYASKLISFLSVSTLGLVLSRFFSFSPIERAIRRDKIDLIFFASPNMHALSVAKTPFMVAAWDIGHRTLSSFPEFRDPLEFAIRERLLKFALPRAFRVFAESQFTKNNLLRICALEESQVVNIGISLAVSPEWIPQNVEKRSAAFVYPAQFWSHKNHLTILRAFAIVQTHHPEVELFLVGSDKGNFDLVKEQSVKLGIADKVKFTGFVTEPELRDLVSRATAVLMPSLLGPTNVPPVEALSLGTRVIASDAHHFEEEWAESIWLARALDYEEWANLMKKALSGSPIQPAVLDLQTPRQVLQRALEEYQNVLALWANRSLGSGNNSPR